MYIVLGIIAIIMISIIIIYNSIIKLENNIDKSESGIDVYLQQRFDLIPNLIEVTKGYANYEKDILEKITRLRNQYNENKDRETIDELNHQYKTMVAVVENYPELKASEQFLNLQKTLVKVESQLQAARRIYNNDVTKYNTRITIFPNNLIAETFHFKEKELFVLNDEDKVNIEF